MKQAGTENERMEFDFKVPDTGDYRFQIDEGIKLETNVTSGKTSLWIPSKVVECRGGESEENLDLQVTHFVPINSDFGAKQIAHILSITGLFEAFDKKFPGEDVDISSEEFVNALKLKLPGKLFDGGINTVEKDGKRRANFKYIEKVGAGKGAKAGAKGGTKAGKAAAPTPPPVAAGADAGADGDDW